MKLTILGYWGAYPSAAAATSGYLLESAGAKILLDCGSGVLAQLQHHIALEELDALVLSHYHADHLADVFCLQYATMILMQLGKRKKPLRIYAPQAVRECYRRMEYGAYCEARPIADGLSLEIAGLRFSFVRTRHPVPCLAMRIASASGVLVYTADTAWDQRLLAHCKRADLLVAEASLYDEQYGQVEGHLTAGEAGKLAALADAQKLVLTHLPHYGDHQRLLQQAACHYQGTSELARTGAVYDLAQR
ncbi:MBL fold metallo-hydrolase [Brevibacillus marinus]|uniref:MBL fold metallo-hydrolase n=1 Tax=Brevibacillus marinus TaxID=2496837 RepID=UPI000F8387E8|nr:MBL fold metallo-hydrolase [Brevibacillus marinus]